MSDFNQQVIAEFRANGGRVGGSFADASLLLLHTTGARTGAARVNPMVYLRDGERVFVFASRRGADTHPDWYFNLKANPDVRVEIGTEDLAARAVVLEGEERDRVFARQVELQPRFGEYQAKTARVIPVIELVPAAR